MTTTVTTQKELDAALKSKNEEIHIESPAGVWLELRSSEGKYVSAYDSASVRAYGSASVSAYDSASVRAYGSASVRAYGSASVSAYDSASVSAYGSASVRAYGSASVSAYDSASVRAYGSASVSAYDSASVSAYGSASVSAYDSASVRAYGSASVSAYDSASVRASQYVAVHLHSAKVTHEGGVPIDVSHIDRSDPNEWANLHGADISDGELILFKAVDKDLKSGRGFAYPIGETVIAPDWAAGDFCGSGLHFCPSAAQTLDYFSNAARFLKVAVRLDEVSVIEPNAIYTTPKVKAKGCRVLAEVDVHGREVTL